jgi:hypothetical protein
MNFRAGDAKRISALEYLIAVIAEEVRMRSLIWAVRQEQFTAQHACHRIGQSIPRNKNAVILIDRDKTAIEHPMYCARKRQPISN